MSSIRIRTRTNSNGEKRFLVYYRRGGTGYPEEYGGSFKTKREAQVRCHAIAGEIAALRDPQLLIKAPPRMTPPPKPTLKGEWAKFGESRTDVEGKAVAKYANSAAWWLRILGANRDPHTITVQDVIDGIAEMIAAKLTPGTIAQYLSPLRQVLDFCDVIPNPVDSKKVRLPRGRVEEINPPTTDEWIAIRDHVHARSLLALRLMECCGLRISECVNLRYGDIDFMEGKMRVARINAKTVAGRRWVPVPDELLEEIGALCPILSRSIDLRVFPPTLRADVVRKDMQNACVKAEVAKHHPHELRHRRVSLWLRLGFDPVQVSRWAGHARTSMSLDTYGHIVLDPEGDEWRDFWREVYRPARVEEEL